MAKEQHKIPKQLLHPTCDADAPGVMGSNHSHADQSCEQKDEREAWALLVSRAGLNADMLVSEDHTETEWKYTFERPEVTLPTKAELEEAKLKLEQQLALVNVHLDKAE